MILSSVSQLKPALKDPLHHLTLHPLHHFLSELLPLSLRLRDTFQFHIQNLLSLFDFVH